MCSYFDTENWTLFGYLCNCKEKGVLETQTIEHRNYLRFLKLLENVPEKKIQAGNAIKVSIHLPKYQTAILIQYSICTILRYVMMVRAHSLIKDLLIPEEGQLCILLCKKSKESTNIYIYTIRIYNIFT